MTTPSMEAITRWHDHEAIDEHANKELAEIGTVVHYVLIVGDSLEGNANFLKVALEAAFQLGRRYPIEPQPWE